MATNFEIIFEAAEAIGFDYTGLNLRTFAEWKKEGMNIKKGEKAVLKVALWKPFKVTEKDEKTGEEKEVTRFKLVDSSLFGEDQVIKGENKKTATKKKAAPKKKKQKHTFTRVGA